MPLAKDLLHPLPEEERRKHKKKRLVQHPNSFFMDVKCPGCYKITTVFSHAQTVVLCVGCSTVLCQPTGGRARLTEVYMLAKDLLHPLPEDERRKHKKKRLVQHPNSYFMDVKCPGCYKITTVFSHAQTVVVTSKPLPKSAKVQQELLRISPDGPQDSHLLNVAILGAPNAGKSTFINALAGTKIVSVSSKVHTTEKSASVVLSEGTTQIVILDTPGVVNAAEAKRHRLPSTFVRDPEKCSEIADALVVIHDASNPYQWNQLDPTIRKILELNSDKQSLLVLNKVDKIKSKRTLLDLMRVLSDGVVDGKACVSYSGRLASKSEAKFDADELAERFLSRESLSRSGFITTARRNDEEHSVETTLNNESGNGWSSFSRVFMVSSLTGDGIADVKETLINMALPLRWKYHPVVTTDQDPKDLVLQFVREKFLDKLKKEMPYMLNFKITTWKIVDDDFFIQIQVVPAKPHWVRYLIGSGGRHVREIAMALEEELSKLFRCNTKVSITVGGGELQKNKPALQKHKISS
ncbi:unnamed protein product [Notodromas monacha]|uniref:40S ribosomal protein S27 n=1 Tax=Notodromas monacha TaxID=399045 RepID=A0A7R9BHJ8_9CRUS|nr:unnamed protein product [Notodromas monacha]CAG0915598.1 unnamed protein product [Notodromas monacha]